MSKGAPPLETRFAAALPADTSDTLALAVSGGGDSMAMLHLAARHAAATGMTLKAVTVDHRLRPEAAAEAALVARICGELGVPHTTLHWTGWDGHGNLPDRARRARYGLMADWAHEARIPQLALAHTCDDLAETFLMRLAREAGVDGLAAMRARWEDSGVIWLRPMLGFSRSELRGWLRAQGLDWVDDPTNDDLRYERIKARHVLAALAPLGIKAETLAAVAGNLADVRAALAAQTHEAARRIARSEAGDVIFDRVGFADLPTEVARRLMVHALTWVSSAEYGPRSTPLAATIDAALHGRPSTLHGCRILPKAGELRVTREWQAVRGLVAQVDKPWDKRWYLSGPENSGLELRALGPAGLLACPDWRTTNLPRASLLASPSVWRGDMLIAAPLAGRTHGWTANTGSSPDEFFLSVLSH